MHIYLDKYNSYQERGHTTHTAHQHAPTAPTLGREGMLKLRFIILIREEGTPSRSSRLLQESHFLIYIWKKKKQSENSIAIVRFAFERERESVK